MNKERDADLRVLCLSLAKADTEKEVIKLLNRAGFWNDTEAWIHYDDNENNFATIGNQQSKPDSALVEKIVNSVDAVLTRECLRRGINAEGEDAPSTMSEAQHEFFGIYGGRLSNLTQRRRAELADNIAVVATGKRSRPSYAIIDRGEGQSPRSMPKTFLSLTKSNKLRIPFVQGRFNMGATGALQFCGRNNLHLIISRRDPEIAKSEDDETADYWGFTVIRREDPKGGMKNSTFRYLAPGGNILIFKGDSLPLLPGRYPEAFGQPLEWGSFVKLYEYQVEGRLKAPILLDMYYRLSLLLPNIALPVTLYERRKGYTAHTYHTTMSGLSARLDEAEDRVLESGFPSSSSLRIEGHEMDVLVYCFEKGKRKRYSGRDGIVFTIAGQAHGFMPSTFFSRRSVGLSYLDDSILVVADCTKFGGRTKEDLFMNSRDRLRQGDLKHSIEKELEQLLNKHQGLRELKERRRREEIQGKIGDSKPLQETIQRIIKKSPTLTKLFIHGTKLPNPFDLRGVEGADEFDGAEHPTYFRLVKDFPEDKPRNCATNKRFRVQFETDARNDYFKRDVYPGRFRIWVGDRPVDHTLNLWNGLANLTARFPPKCQVGDNVHFECEVVDETLVDPFQSGFFVRVRKEQDKKGGPPGERKEPPSDDKGSDRERPSHLALPNIVDVRRTTWEEYDFDRESSLKVRYGGEESGYDFYINMDNIHLQTEIKGRPRVDPQLLEAQYKYGVVLIGLAILNEYEKAEDKDEEEDVYENIRLVTQAISPFLLPMISSLGDIEATS